MTSRRIALVGDFNPDVLAHRAISECFALARQASPDSVIPEWVATDTIVPGDETSLQQFTGIWCTPASPYRSTEGALWAIQYARTHAVPFLGTCGGFQHALLEFARNVLGFAQAAHAELDPDASLPLLDRLQCPLLEKSQPVTITNPTFQRFYGASSGLEGFHCSYGLNPAYEKIFAGTALEIVARSSDGQARACMLKGHPFFLGTQFQPERRALQGSLHTLVQAFFTQPLHTNQKEPHQARSSRP
jgi:CTP synthase (UTP-ammonia lyase)